LKNIPKDNYIHQLAVIDVYFKLMEQYLGTKWLSERYIKREKYDYDVGQKIKHLCDGILVLPNDKQIAIEVELTMKTKERLQDIIIEYVLHRRLKEVCTTAHPKRLSGCAGLRVSGSMLKFMDWNELKFLYQNSRNILKNDIIRVLAHFSNNQYLTN
jgi:hypothetical protein